MSLMTLLRRGSAPKRTAESVETEAASQTCRRCGNIGFRVQWRIDAIKRHHIGLASFPFLTCGLTPDTGCGRETRGKRP